MKPNIIPLVSRSVTPAMKTVIPTPKNRRRELYAPVRLYAIELSFIAKHLLYKSLVNPVALLYSTMRAYYMVLLFFENR